MVLLMENTSRTFGTLKEGLFARAKHFLTGLSSAYNLPLIGATVAVSGLMTGGVTWAVPTIANMLAPISGSISAGVPLAREVLGTAGMGALAGLLFHAPQMLTTSLGLLSGEMKLGRSGKRHRKRPAISPASDGVEI